MRRFFFALCLAVLVLPQVGCLKSKATYTLKKDGSGTISSSYVVQLGKMRELLSTALMMMNPEAAQKLAELEDENLPNPVAPGWLHALAKGVEGYKIKKATDVVTDGARTTSVEATFDTLQAAARGGAFFTFGVALSRVDKSEAVPKGAWKLVLKDILLGSSSDAMGGMSATEMAPMFETQLKTLSLTSRVTLPTAILETNGKKNEKGDTVTWSIDYEKVIAGKDVSMSVTFEAADDLKLKPFTYTPDLNALVKRMMENAPKLKKAVEELVEGEPEPKPPTAKPDAPKPDAPKPDAPKDGGK